MKKAFLLVAASLLVLSIVSFDILHATGETSTTGSPGEGLCNGCHGGGTGVTTISISSTPAFTNNAFDPLTVYTIQIAVENSSLGFFGFDCEVLTPSNVSTGTMSNPGSGVKILNGFNGRRNALHSTKKAGVGGIALFTFEWTSPQAGDATIYASGNAVNNNNSTNGDTPSGGAVLTLTNVNTSTPEYSDQTLSAVIVYPNPSNDFVNVSFTLNESTSMDVEVVDITGKLIKTLLHSTQYPGPHKHIFDLKGITPGIYFLKISAEKNTLSQKLITIN
jgi:hypothetical protein